MPKEQLQLLESVVNFKDYFGYKVPIGVFLIFVFLMIILYLLVSSDSRKRDKESTKVILKNNELLRLQINDLREDVRELRSENKNLRQDFLKLFSDKER